MSDYQPTIGLEIHAELKTSTKMFCNSKNDPDEVTPNVNICPVCMAHPGTLPVINKQAVKLVLKVGRALGSKISNFTEFDRKNYFYPDIPKGYQISQYKYPLVSGGSLNNVKITRVHLEEDTARSTHERGGYSLVDFNRAGVPLMELVTEPVIKTAKEAGDFARELQLLLRYLGVSDANMEKGEMRVEANISLMKMSDLKNEKGLTLGTKVEVKNINSFKAVERAILYEVSRQKKVLESGEKVAQETRGWDEKKQKTFSQRSKESAHDYRYFPDPDLPKIKTKDINEFNEIDIPELPEQKRTRYKNVYGIKDEDIEMYIANFTYGNFFERVAKLLKNKKELVKLASNYITSDIVGKAKAGDNEIDNWFTRDPEKTSANFAKLILMASDGTLSSRGAKDILHIMFTEGGDPDEIAKKKNLIQKSDRVELEKIIKEVINQNKNAVAEIRAGKENALKFLIGQTMAATKGSANPKILSEILKELLK